MKATKSKTSSSNLQVQTKQDSNTFFQKAGEGMFSNEATTDIQTKPFFSSEGEVIPNGLSDKPSFFSPATIQPKLTIGQPNDKYEQEADSMADKVVNEQKTPTNDQPSIGSTPIQRKCAECGKEEEIQQKEGDQEGIESDLAIQTKPIFESNEDNANSDIQTKPIAAPPIQTKCSDCEQKEKLQKKEEEISENELDIEKKPIFESNDEPAPEENTVQTKSDSANTVSSDLQSNLNASKGGGQSLPKDTQQSMSSSFGADFSGVRVHTDSNAVQMNKELGAQAFTHGSDIYFNEGKYNPGSTSGKHLLAHELSHTIQQGGSDVQKSPDDESSLRGEVGDIKNSIGSTENSGSEVAVPEGAVSKLQNLQDSPEAKETENNEQGSGNVKAKSERLINTARPTAVKNNIGKSNVESTKEEVEKGPPEEKKNNDGEQVNIPSEMANNLAPKAVSTPSKLIDVIPVPEIQPIKQPKINPIVDAGGQGLNSNIQANNNVLELGNRVSILREWGFSLREAANEMKSNANVIQKNIAGAKRSISESEANVQSEQSNLDFRKEVLDKANQSLSINQEKEQMVSQKAPELIEKADEGKEDSGPMSEEANQLVGENEANSPEDSDASEKLNEQGGKLNQVNSDTETMDSAISQTKEEAETLNTEAIEAQQKNLVSQTQILSTETSLNQTNTKLEEFSAQNAAGKAKFGSLEKQPQTLINSANQLDRTGIATISASIELEEQINSAQEVYENEMQQVPEIEMLNSPDTSNGVIQRQVEGRYNERTQLGLSQGVTDNLPSWLTGVDPQTEEERNRQQLEAEERRIQQIQRIEDRANGNFENLGTGSKMLIAAQLTGENLFNQVTSASWAGFFGHLLQGLVDPRIGLMGVISGLDMTLSGAANLFSAEQWSEAPVNNALKSAADIATGIAIILGSITLLATAIGIILSAICIIATIFTGGAACIPLAPIIAFCWSTMATVGGWTILAAKIALVLQALTFIKNLYDAAVATSSSDLQNQSEQMTADATSVGNMAMMIGLAKVGEVVGQTSLGQRAASGVNGFLGRYGVPPPLPTATPRENVPVKPNEPSTILDRHGRPMNEPVGEPQPILDRHGRPMNEPFGEPQPILDRHGRPMNEPVGEPQPILDQHGRPMNEPVGEPQPILDRHGRPMNEPVSEPQPILDRHGRPMGQPTPQGMSPKLMGVRRGLQSQEAISEFDNMFGRMERNSGRMERAIEGMQRSGNLEEKLIDKWSLRNPTPHGEALSEFSQFKGEVNRLIEDINTFGEANPDVAGVRTMSQTATSELGVIDSVLSGKIEATPSRATGVRNNLGGIREELIAAQSYFGVIGVNRRFTVDGRANAVEVDVVANEGRAWIDRKNVPPFSRESTNWRGAAGKQGLEAQVRKLLRGASQNPLPDGTVPEVIIDFPRGVSQEVAVELVTMGATVRGVIQSHPNASTRIPAIPPENDRNE